MISVTINMIQISNIMWHTQEIVFFIYILNYSVFQSFIVLNIFLYSALKFVPLYYFF